jgi:hypothetical protein
MSEPTDQKGVDRDDDRATDPSCGLRPSEGGRIDAPGGDLHQFGLNGELADLDQARAAVAKEPSA